MKCHHCGKQGHRKAECWELHPELKPDQANNTRDQYEVAFMVHEDIEYEEWIYEAPGPEVNEEVDDFNELESILGELKDEEDQRNKEREDRLSGCIPDSFFNDFSSDRLSCMDVP